MANSKNTIQNIPLASELCMNALKTEVKQFQGYNEKNTTLYGGTLSPMYDNTVELFDKDNSYTVFNSKGVPFTVLSDGESYNIYKNNELVPGTRGTYVHKTEVLDVPEDAVIAARVKEADSDYEKVIYVDKSGQIYADGTPCVVKAHQTGSTPVDNTPVKFDLYRIDDARIWVTSTYIIVLAAGQRTSGVSSSSSVQIWVRSYLNPIGADWYKSNNDIALDSDFDPRFYAGYQDFNDSHKFTIITYPKCGVITDLTAKVTTTIAINVPTGQSATFTTSYNPGLSTNLFIENFYSLSTSADRRTINLHLQMNPDSETWPENERVFSVNLQQYAVRWIYEGHYESFKDYETKHYYYYRLLDNGNVLGYVGKNGDDVTCPLGSLYNSNGSVYYVGSETLSVGMDGVPIDTPLGFDRNIFTRALYGNSSAGRAISYKRASGEWCCFIKAMPREHIECLKDLIIDDRYIFIFSNGLKIYDTEKEDFLETTKLDWIISNPPYTNLNYIKQQTIDPNQDGYYDTVGYVYAAGENAEYPIDKTPFVGYLPNPFLGYGLPDIIGKTLYGMEIKLKTNYPIPAYGNDEAQYFYTFGSTAQSASYQGNLSRYKGTTYPIDTNGNEILPITLNAEIIEGYSNNDLMKVGSTVYPMMYYNNNEKIYAYQLLSMMENVTNAFSLQGQQYSVDEDAIYALSYSNGVISNVQAVTYKKNLTFLGTLPTQAVFWSDYNKTFYAFTGDRILSKMFEASDINKIHYVGQNPSSLSLWICSDTGIYIISDTDMFKLDFNSSQVSFMPQKTIIVTEGETNNEAHYVSLYLKKGEKCEMIPVKLQTAYYGLGGEMKAVMDCWYLRLFDEKNTKGYVKAKVHTITDITRHTEEKTFEVNPSDYDENHIVYLRFQPKYQECVSMQLELETNLGIYQISLGVNTTDSTAQVSKFNF